MPGYVADYIRKTQLEAEMEALDQLIHLLEERYAPEPYDEEGLDDKATEYRDREYEADWQSAQRAASKDLKRLRARYPEMSAVVGRRLKGPTVGIINVAAEPEKYLTPNSHWCLMSEWGRIGSTGQTRSLPFPYPACSPRSAR